MNYSIPQHPDESKKHFSLLIAHLHRGGAWRYFWTPNGGDAREYRWSEFAPTNRPLLIPREWRDRNLFFGVHPTRAKRKRAQRSTLDTIAAINALFAEYDGVHEVTQEEAGTRYTAPDVTGLTLQEERAAIKGAWDAAADSYFVDHFEEMMQRARARVDAAPVPPSALWCSGGGYQAVWLLRDTVEVTPANRDDLRDVQRRWVATVGGDPAAADLTRVLRVPGSRNWKARYGPQGAAVAWVRCDLSIVYDLATLRDLATVDPSTRPRPGGGGGGGGHFGPADNPPPVLPDTAAVAAFNRGADIRGVLLDRGYTDAGSGRMNRPGGSGRALVLNADNTATVWGSSDPLFTGGRRVTPADVVCVYDHSGDVAATLAALGGAEEEQTRAEIDAALAWVGGPDAVEHLQAAGIRRAADYLRTLTALLLAARTRGSWQVALSSRQLGERRNISHVSAWKHIGKLRGAELLAVVEDDNGALFDLAPLRSLKLTPYCSTEQLPGVNFGDHNRANTDNQARGGVNFTHINTADAYTPAHIADDAYTPVTMPRALVRRGMNQYTEPSPLLRSLTSSALRVVATLAQYPDATAGDLAALCGLSTNAVRGQLRTLARLGLILWEQEGRTRVYTLRPDHEARLDELRPHMTGYGAGLILARRNAEDRARWSDFQAREARRDGEREEETRHIKRAARLRRKGAAAAADLAAAGIDPDAKIAPSAPPVQRETIQTQAQRLDPDRRKKRRTSTQQERERWAEFRRHLAAARASWPELEAWCDVTGTSYSAAIWDDRDALVDLYMSFLADTAFHGVPNIAYAGTVGA